MKPVDFKESNIPLAKPSNTTDEQCGSLNVYTDGEYCISCWKPTLKERIKILFNGKIWLWVWSGKTQPPVCVDAKKPFKKTKKYKYRRWNFVFHTCGSWSFFKCSIMKYNTCKIYSWWRLALHIDNKITKRSTF